MNLVWTDLVEMMSPKAKRFTRLPDGRASYQRHKYLAALPFVKQRKVFVDIGAHVGLWSMQAALDFEKIVAFEPHPLHASLYEHNMQGQKYTLHRVALGDRKDNVALKGEPGTAGIRMWPGREIFRCGPWTATGCGASTC
jgi:hypothetical protein